MKVKLIILLLSISKTLCDDVPINEHQLQGQNGKSENDSNEIKGLNVVSNQRSSNDWTVILRRQSGAVNFYRNWADYKTGFGDLNGEFFIGLEVLYQLTSNGPPQELSIELTDFQNQQRYANYDLFVVGSEEEKYALKNLGSYSGNAGDSLGSHVGKPFSTFDQNNDGHGCSLFHVGAWWYDHCYDSHLTGEYLQGSVTREAGINWRSWQGVHYSLKSAVMKIRPKALK